MRPEIEFRKPFLDLWPGSVTMVEPALGSTFGVADAWVAFRGYGLQVEGWVEFKVPDERGCFVLRPEQRLWHRQQLKHTSNVAVVVVSEMAFWVVPSRSALISPCVVNAPVRGVTWDDIRLATSPSLLPSLLSAAFDGNEE